MPGSEPRVTKTSRLPSWFAAYGAIVATLALSWNVFQYFDSRPRLGVEIDTSIFGESTLFPAVHSTATNPRIRFVNKGSKPLTIYFMEVDFQPDSALPNLPGYSSVIGSPLKLDVGDEKDWKPVLLSYQPTPKEDLEIIEISGRLRLVALTTTGKYQTQSHIKLAFPKKVGP